MQNALNIKLGQVAIRLGFLSKEQAHDCLSQVQAPNQQYTILDLAISLSYLDATQAQLVLSHS